ncbi:hypothetical protein [Streptomyces jumonjinensis]|uniref:hypothetical protein n=1 Tax=Streptomyces jumonjinensis TaxID=1945 RepID=UPI0037BCA16A
MHGPGYLQQPPGRRPAAALLIALRVLFTVLSVGSLGLLSWAAMLRLAIVRRRPLDWVLFCLSLALSIASFAMFLEVGDDSDPPTPKGETEPATGFDLVLLLVLIATALGVPVHYLVAEIRHFQPPAPGWTPPPAASPYSVTTPVQGLPMTPGYGYPQPGTPGTPGTPVTPGYGYPPPVTRTHQPPPGPSPYTAPPPLPPPRPDRPPLPTPSAPAAPSAPSSPSPSSSAENPRIDQVRAELDELSDYLRKERGR